MADNVLTNPLTVQGNITIAAPGTRLLMGSDDSTLSLLGGKIKGSGSYMDFYGQDNAGTPGGIELVSKGMGNFVFYNSPTPGTVTGQVELFRVSPLGLFSFSGTAPGIRLSNLTTTQRDAIVSPQSGNLIFNTDTKKLNFYDGTAWQPVA